LSARLPIAVGGAGASPELVTAAGARQLPGDPVTAADALTESAVAAAV
jgi:hypothetical protein